MLNWFPDLNARDMPRYLAIAAAIAADVRTGALKPGDRLPPQRKLAARLGVDFTTVARGYGEAQKRGLVRSHVGQGTCVLQITPALAPRAEPPRWPQFADLSMNLPPEPDDPSLIERMREGFIAVGADLNALLRYQGFGGAQADKDAASAWLSRRALVPVQDRLFVCPGAHSALLAIFGLIAKSGETLLSEAITYPGARAIAAQLGIELVGLEVDEDGVTPEALADACKRLKPKGLYLNPTLQNPTTLTIPERRRVEIAAVARKFRLPIIEDDAYGFIPLHGPHPFAAIAPDLTWHIAGLAKCIGAGIRAAYVLAPEKRLGWPFAAAVRAACVMASPLTVALATRWIEDGTADAILRFIRNETAARQTLAREILTGASFKADPLSFNLWTTLPPGWTRSAFIGGMRSAGIGIVASDAFTVAGPRRKPCAYAWAAPSPAPSCATRWNSWRTRSSSRHWPHLWRCKF